MKGLIGRDGLDDGEALLLHAKRVHTFGMRISLDILFCDRDGRVLKIYRGIGPRRVTRRVSGTHTICELADGAGWVVVEGETLSFRDL
jgi:uncharacterized membrane protein (UPF0127 family)